MLGDSRHLSNFDDLKNDECTQKLFGVEEAPGTAAVKRFLARFVAKHELRFRDILIRLFLRRLRDVRPEVIFLGLDSMVLDNDDSTCRQGVDSTYKGCMGYHPLQLTWMGMIIDGMFRRGNRGTHEFENTVSMLERAVGLIRAELGENTPIIIRMDAGYCDEKLMIYLNEELKVGFQVGGRLYEDFKQNMFSVPEEAWEEYNSKGRSWKFMEMGFKCKSWDQYYRAVLTQVDSREDGSLYLDFTRPTSLIITNLGQNSELFGGEHEDELQHYMSAEAQVKLYQGRGVEELCHRGFKD
ncbi:MAG: transposase, partial [Akkermansiaceae bacterium]